MKILVRGLREITEYEMYKYVYMLLRKKYPKKKRWEIKPQWRGSTYRPDFLVERRVRGIIQRIIVEVKAQCSIRESHIKQLNSYVSKVSGPNVRILEKILVVPGRARVSEKIRVLAEQSNIKIKRLKKIQCINSRPCIVV